MKRSCFLLDELDERAVPANGLAVADVASLPTFDAPPPFSPRRAQPATSSKRRQ
jgi:hypothetical protein